MTICVVATRMLHGISWLMRMGRKRYGRRWSSRRGIWAGERTCNRRWPMWAGAGPWCLAAGAGGGSRSGRTDRRHGRHWHRAYRRAAPGPNIEDMLLFASTERWTAPTCASSRCWSAGSECTMHGSTQVGSPSSSPPAVRSGCARCGPRSRTGKRRPAGTPGSPVAIAGRASSSGREPR